MSLLAGAGWATVRIGLAALSLVAACGSLLAAALAVWGVRSGRVDWSFAVHVLVGTAVPALALAAVILGLAAAASALAIAPRTGPAPAAAAILLGAGVLMGFAAWRVGQERAALANPPLHDVATDWRDPLMPTAALLRVRGERALPIEAAPALAEGPRGGFLGRPVAEVNAATCPRAEPLRLQTSAADAYRKVKAAALGAGLRLVTDDPAAGVIEASGPAPLAYGGRADVLARVRADAVGARVDLRSISRHGVVDGGTNCRRILRLLALAAG